MAPSAAASVSVVVVIFNSADVVQTCVESLPPEVELVVVDNGSSDGGLQLAQQARPDLVSIRSRNDGFGAGCNRGANAATRDTLMFLNPDAVIDKTSIEGLAAVARERDAIVGPAIVEAPDRAPEPTVRRWSRPGHEILMLLPSGTRWAPSWARRDLPPGNPVYERGGAVDYIQGACMVMPRVVFDAIGGFDERFFLYCEEEDLCERAADRGIPTVYLPSAHVVHVGGTSTAKVSDLVHFHAFRSRAILYRKRHGAVRGAAAIGAIGLAIFFRSVVAGATALGGRATSGWSVTDCWTALRGLAAGATAR